MSADDFHVFCEGNSGSYDNTLLNRLVEKYELKVIVVPAAGKSALNNFARGKLGKDGRFICLRDRDFDKTPENDKLIEFKKDLWALSRTRIENYLIDPVLLFQYWEKTATDETKSRYPNLSIADFNAWIQQAAKSIRYFQASRWALAKAIEKIPHPNQLSIHSTPVNLEKDSCLNHAKEIWEAYFDKLEIAKRAPIVDSFLKYAG